MVAKALAARHDAVVCLGVIVRGGTPHFEYVSAAATDGCARVALDTGTPVGFGVLTCDDDAAGAGPARACPAAPRTRARRPPRAALETALLLRDLAGRGAARCRLRPLTDRSVRSTPPHRKASAVLSLVLPKGSLEKQVLELFDAADLTVVRGGDRDYHARIHDPRIDRVRFLRPQEIPTYVEQGIFDLGISGRDWVTETGADVVSLGEIGGGRAGESVVSVVLAVPKESDWTSVKDLPDGVRISTEMPETTKRFLAEHGVSGRVFTSHGATEAKIPDIVDAIVDLTETGSSLRKAGLKIIETLITSRTELLANVAAHADPEKRAAMDDIALLLQGALRARGQVLLKLNVPADRLDAVVARAALDELADGHEPLRGQHAGAGDGRAQAGRQHAHPGAEGGRCPRHPRDPDHQDRRVSR